MREKFWETVPLGEMTLDEWEALCDGCGRCCLHKLRDENSGRIFFTNIACHLFDMETRRCSNYPQRKELVAQCVTLTPENIASASEWMPASCAYRRLHEGRGLADWHPLVSGRPESVAEAGIALNRKVVPDRGDDADGSQDELIDEDWISSDHG